MTRIGSDEGRTGDRLIDAAAALLDAGGERAVTLRAVAQAVGVSHNAPYRHFADRAALLAGVAARDFRAFTRAFEAIGRSDRSSMERVKAALATFVTYGEAHPARYRLLFSDPDIAAQGGPLEIVALETFAAFDELVQAAQHEEKLPALPTPTLTGLIYASVHGLLDLKAGGRMREQKGFSNVLDGAFLMLDLLAGAPR